MRKLDLNDIDRLFDYLMHLSFETKKRFEPHSIDQQSIIELYKYSDIHFGYAAIDIETSEIVAFHYKNWLFGA